MKFVPGFGHRFHPVDPRAPRLLEVVEAAAAAGVVGGRFAAIGRAVEAALARRKGGKRIPMNIDGATAVIYAELGFPPPLCRGLFVLSRSVGALAHAWEQMQASRAQQGPDPAAVPVALSRRGAPSRAGNRTVGRLSPGLPIRNPVKKARADVFHHTCHCAQARGRRSRSTCRRGMSDAVCQQAGR